MQNLYVFKLIEIWIKIAFNVAHNEWIWLDYKYNR